MADAEIGEGVDTAFCTAGVAPTAPPWPIPLAPSGLRDVGVSIVWTSSDGRSAALGMP